jgi:hypothetical protein
LLSGLEKLNIDRVYHWTDSKNVIAWLESDCRKYKKFVELRISEALDYFEEMKIVETRYVPSKFNPADLGTKWATPIDVSPTSFWVNGPDFLKQRTEEWPVNPTNIVSQEEAKMTLLHMSELENNDWNFLEFKNFSSYRKLLRTTAWLYKWIHKFRNKRRRAAIRETSWLTAENLTAARKALIRKAQHETYPDEILALQREDEKLKSVDRSSAIYKLNPVIIDDVLRVGGRLKAADYLSLDQKHPIILKKDHVFTELLLQEYHRTFAHQHMETCVNEIRQKYWIPDLRVCVMTCECASCKALNEKLSTTENFSKSKK